MANCSCGNLAEENSTRCTRCNAFQILELDPKAGAQEIHSAFEVLSKAWDPGRFQDDAKMKAMAEEKLKAITAAYSLLKRGSIQAEPFHARAVRQAEAVSARAANEQASGLGYSEAANRRLPLPMPLLIGCGVLVVGVVAGWLLFKPLDSMLMEMPVVGKIYTECRGEIRDGIQKMKDKLDIGTGSSEAASVSGETSSSPAPDQQTQEKTAFSAHTTSQGNAGRTANRQSNDHNHSQGRVLPLITAGLTKSEVISIQGEPTAETDDELDYGNSKLFFSGGVLNGWRIDPASGIRVKLWPDAMVDPSVRSFGLGSTKNEVLAVQGTPTMFSQSTFGYGRSEVYFQYGKVVGWKDDPATPLRTSAP
jgi:curved DNA-binding protein CbpA